jgi:serine/threonine-protein kinase
MLWYAGAHHVASAGEVDIFAAHLSYALQRVGVAYVFYLAIEPYARRLWPRTLVSWVRVLEGGFRDPLVGRDVLLGAAGGALMTLIGRLMLWIPEALGGPSVLPNWTDLTGEALRGTLPAFVSVVAIHTNKLLEIVFPLTLLLIFRLLFRRTAAAVIAVSVLGIVMFYPGTGSVPGYVIGQIIALVVFFFVLFRGGLLAFASLFTVSALIDELPLTLHPSGWYLGTMLFSLVCIAAPALWGFWTSQAGRPLFRDEILEPATRR